MVSKEEELSNPLWEIKRKIMSFGSRSECVNLELVSRTMVLSLTLWARLKITPLDCLSAPGRWTGASSGRHSGWSTSSVAPSSASANSASSRSVNHTSINIFTLDWTLEKINLLYFCSC